MSALNAEETDVKMELKATLTAPSAVEEYSRLNGSFGGRLLNADLCRELSPHYQSFRHRVQFTRATYEPAAEFVRRRFEEIVGQPALLGARNVLFLAGGAGSGKTVSVGTNVIDEYDLIFDSNLADFEKGRAMIELAADSGWFVDVRYIHRPFGLAVRSMIDRALDFGRYIPLGGQSKLAALHFNAQRTIVKLNQLFASDYRVSIEAIANNWQPERPVKAAPIEIKDLDAGGMYCYNSVKELYANQAPILELLAAISGTIG